MDLLQISHHNPFATHSERVSQLLKTMKETFSSTNSGFVLTKMQMSECKQWSDIVLTIQAVSLPAAKNVFLIGN